MGQQNVQAKKVYWFQNFFFPKTLLSLGLTSNYVLRLTLRLPGVIST